MLNKGTQLYDWTSAFLLCLILLCRNSAINYYSTPFFFFFFFLEFPNFSVHMGGGGGCTLNCSESDPIHFDFKKPSYFPLFSMISLCDIVNTRFTK